jgi:hypothetical protein
MERLSQILQTFDGSAQPPLPCRQVLAKFEVNKFCDAVPLVHKSGTSREYVDKKDRLDYKLIKFNYTVKDCFEVVREVLNSAREEKTSYLGVWMGDDLGDCIIPHFLFDHGGGTFKAVLVTLFSEDCKTTACECVGIGKFTETADILRHHILPDVNAAAKKLSEHYVLTVEWVGEDSTVCEFDYLLVHRDVFGGDDYDNRRRELPTSVVPFYDEEQQQWWITWGSEGAIAFDRIDIPQTGIRFRVIPIIPHAGGDFKSQFENSGRGGHASSKSMKEALLSKMWAKELVKGADITLESIESERADYREVYYAQEGLTSPPSGRIYSAAELKALKQKVNKATALSGITNIPCLLDSIPIKYWVDPMLHIMLGIMNGSKHAIDDFISTCLELNMPAVTHCTIAKTDAKNKLIQQELEHDIYIESTVEVQYKKYCVSEIDRILKLVKNAELMQLVREETTPLTRAQQTAYDKLQVDFAAVWSFRKGTPVREQSDIEIAVYTKRMVELQNSVKLCKEELAGKIAAFKDAKSKQAHNPIRSQVDDVFASVGAVTTQSFTQQWDGHACKKVLGHTSAIIDHLDRVWKESAPLKEPNNEPRCTALKLKCKEFLRKMKALWDVFAYVSSMMGSFDRQEEPVFKRFERACRASGLLLLFSRCVYIP